MKNVPTAPPFLASEIGHVAPDAARFHILPVPLEQTVSYGAGTARGPEAILRASQQLELFDGCAVPAAAGIHTRPPIDCDGRIEEVLARIEAATLATLDAGAVPVLLGGEHTVSLGALKALARRHGRFGVVQFDAHADLRREYEGTEFSHACVMRRAVELGLPLFQVGVRSLCQEEDACRRATPSIGWLDARQLAFSRPPVSLLPSNFPESVYISIDIDCLDAGLMPATGTPEPGGLGWWQLLAMLDDCCHGRRVLGADLVELAPITGLHAPDYTAARLVYALIGAIGG